MTKIEDIEKAVLELSGEELVKFWAWYEQFDLRLFDEKIARDAKTAKLDFLAETAIADYHAGKAREL